MANKIYSSHVFFRYRYSFVLDGGVFLPKLKEWLLSEKCLPNCVLDDKNMSVSANQCKLKFAWTLRKECLYIVVGCEVRKFVMAAWQAFFSMWPGKFKFTYMDIGQRFIYSIHYSEMFLSTPGMLIP